jgi:chromatin structure-remodeling complex subunit SFH1
MHLIDRIEWDLTSSLTPEEFATQLCSDIGLGGESIMIISHAIHEELLRLKKDCLESGVLANMAQNGQGQSSGGTGMGLGKLNVAPAGPKKLAGVWRDWNEAMSFGPHVEMLLPDEIVSGHQQGCLCALKATNVDL